MTSKPITAEIRKSIAHISAHIHHLNRAELAANLKHLVSASTTVLGRLEEAEDKLEAVSESLQGFWLGVHLDGVNKHGSHILSLSPMSIDFGGQQEVDEELAEIADSVFSDAAKLGHKESHAVVIKWVADYDGFRYVGIDDVLTALLYGSAETQFQKFAAMDKRDE